MRLIDADKLPRHGGRGGIVHWSDIEKAPTVDAVPVRHGEWTRHVLGSTGYGTTVMHQCSECECMAISRFRYCPNCGAKMDGAERKEE